MQMKKDKAAKPDIDAAVVELKRLKDVCGEVPPPKKKWKYYRLKEVATFTDLISES